MSLALVLSGVALAQAPVTRTLPRDMPTVHLLNTAGSVTVIHDPSAAESSVTALPVNWAEGCEVVFRGDASLAEAEVLRPNGRTRCRTDWTLVLAGDTVVDLDLGRADVRLERTQSVVLVDARSARVELVDTQAPVHVALGTGRVFGTSDQVVTASVGMGKVRLEDLSAPVDAVVQVGGVRLEFTEAPDETVVARAGVGRVRTALPYGTYVNSADFNRRGSTFRTEIPHRNAAANRLEGGAGFGSTRVDTVLEHEPESGVADAGE